MPLKLEVVKQKDEEGETSEAMNEVSSKLSTPKKTVVVKTFEPQNEQMKVMQ